MRRDSSVCVHVCACVRYAYSALTALSLQTLKVTGNSATLDSRIRVCLRACVCVWYACIALSHSLHLSLQTSDVTGNATLGSRVDTDAARFQWVGLLFLGLAIVGCIPRGFWVMLTSLAGFNEKKCVCVQCESVRVR